MNLYYLNYAINSRAAKKNKTSQDYCVINELIQEAIQSGCDVKIDSVNKKYVIERGDYNV